jgi:hypothetical protein
MRTWSSLSLLPGLLISLAGFSAAQETNFPVGPQYLITNGSPLFLGPIATPTLSFNSGLNQPKPNEAAAGTSRADEETLATVTSILNEQRQTALLSIYYGLPRASVIEIAFHEPAEGESALTIPSSIFEAGVVELTSAPALHERGYGATLVEAAARAKTYKTSTRHVYTNEDLERLRPRN